MHAVDTQYREETVCPYQPATLRRSICLYSTFQLNAFENSPRHSSCNPKVHIYFHVYSNEQTNSVHETTKLTNAQNPMSKMHVTRYTIYHSCLVDDKQCSNCLYSCDACTRAHTSQRYSFVHQYHDATLAFPFQSSFFFSL